MASSLIRSITKYYFLKDDQNRDINDLIFDEKVKMLLKIEDIKESDLVSVSNVLLI